MTDDSAQEWCWAEGWRVLMEIGGYSERAARTLTGKFIKENGAAVVMRGLRKAVETKPADPMSWLQAGFAKIRQQNAWKRTSGRIDAARIPEFDRSKRVSPEKMARAIAELRALPGPFEKHDGPAVPQEPSDPSRPL